MQDEKSCEICTGGDQETVWLYVMVHRSMGKSLIETILMNLRELPQPATLSKCTRMVIKILTDLPSQPFFGRHQFFHLDLFE